ncbi:MAG: hypothetical protein Q8O67_16195 [Deltaproteobacteria bacterium]|nr:hypothetical protein [Deltaproteobacteria bacterium]
MAPLIFLSAFALVAPVDPVADPAVVDSVVAEVTAADRGLAAASASIGAAAGGFVGGSLALGLSAVLSGVDDRAALLPLLVLPPLCSGLGAFVSASAITDQRVGFAAGAGAVGATAAWAVVVGALLAGDEDRLLAGRFDLTFAATALVPAAVAVVGAGLVAPWFASPSE